MTTPFSFKLIIAALVLSAAATSAQNAGINSTGATPNASSILDLNTGNTFTSPNGKGLLIPNISLTTTTDVTTVASPSNSLIVYNSNSGITGTGAAGTGYYYYSTSASRWINLIDNLAPGGAWMLNGNTGNTSPAVPATYGTSTIGTSENWLGNTDAIDIVFGTSNIERMRIDKTTGHVVIGSATPSASRKLYVTTSTTSANGAAIWGDATATATTNFGVFGSTASTANLSAGVRGYSGATTVTAGNNAGIWGENSCANGYGAAGLNTSVYNTGGPYSYVGLYGSKQGAAVTGTGYAVYGTATNSATTNYGGFFTASGATTNVGGYFSGSAGTNNYAIVVPSTGGNVGIGTTAPSSLLMVSKNISGPPSLFYGQYSDFGYGNTFTDNTTAASGTTPIVMFNHFASPTLAASNTNVTTSYASTVRIDGPPIKGTNNTATDAVGLRIDNTGVGAHTRSWGLWVEASSGATNNYAAYLNGMVGISKIPAFTLDINGTANCTSNSWTSDERKKKNIQNLSLSGLDIIHQLKPVTFEWKEVKDDGMKGVQMGFIAQEIEKILPAMVITANDSEKSKGVKYNELLPILVKAIQEQQSIIEEQKDQLNKQNDRIEKMEVLISKAQK